MCTDLANGNEFLAHYVLVELSGEHFAKYWGFKLGLPTFLPTFCYKFQSKTFMAQT